MSYHEYESHEEMTEKVSDEMSGAEFDKNIEAEADVGEASSDSPSARQKPYSPERLAYKKGVRRGALIAVIVFLLMLGACCIAFYIVRKNAGIVWSIDSAASEGGAGLYDEETISKLAKLSYYIDKYYLYDIDSGQISDALAHALFDSLDENYTHYYSAEEYEQYLQSNADSYYGIGITIQSADNGGIYVIYVAAGSPAEGAGVSMGDRLLKINGTDLEGMTSTEAAALISGSELGTQITLEIYREETDKTLTAAMAVDVINYVWVTYSMEESDIGYIYLSTFSEASAEQFLAAVEELKAEGMKGLILDLRYNGGGSLDALICVADAFLPEGEVLLVDYTGSGEKVYSCSGENELDIPIVILVNESTASAAEALTAAAHDMGVATIVGTQTFGKGIVQSIFELSDGSAVKLTTAYYYTPSGVCIQGEGITPDIVLEDEATETKDPQYDAAVEVILNSLSK